MWTTRWGAGSTSPVMGNKGDAAKKGWNKFPEKSPIGSIIRKEAPAIVAAARKKAVENSLKQIQDNEWTD